MIEHWNESPPPDRSNTKTHRPGLASAPLPGDGNTAQEPPAEALQLLQASQTYSEPRKARTDGLKYSFRQNELIKKIFFVDSGITDRLRKYYAGRNEGNGILRYKESLMIA
jgi:hypothetical protein